MCRRDKETRFWQSYLEYGCSLQFRPHHADQRPTEENAVCSEVRVLKERFKKGSLDKTVQMLCDPVEMNFVNSAWPAGR
jgi:hypothetical protein